MSEPIVRVLMAGGDHSVRLLMQAALEGHEFAVTLVETGEAALQAFAAAPLDIILLDVEMPRQDRYPVCGAIRRLQGMNILVALVTGHGDR